MERSEDRAQLASIAPFFIVRDVPAAVAFYRDRLGFEVQFTAPGDDPFFAIIQRDGARIFLKAILPAVQPTPNPTRHPWARWDAFIHTPAPEALAAELTSRGTPFHEALRDTDDGLRGFEIKDADGYVLFFGRPV
jgi:catechol 2,3-dioxygenase-like lactoylglutathione lyase family enzyme